MAAKRPLAAYGGITKELQSGDTLSFAAIFGDQNANQVLAGPGSGSAAAPTFRALVSDDIPNLSTDKLTSGTLPVARGGTNATSQSTNGINFFNGTSVTSGSTLTWASSLHRIFGASGTEIRSDVASVNPIIYIIGGTGGNFPQFDLRPAGNSALGGTVQSNSNNGGISLTSRGAGTRIQSNLASAKVLFVTGATSQTGNLFEVQNVGGTGLAAFDAAGFLGIGVVASLSAALQVRRTAEQFRSEYDATHYWNAITGSGGETTLSGGTGAKFVFSKDIDLSERILQDGLDIEPYFVYEALISQSGSSAPTVSILKNTIGAIVWTRTAAGNYTGTLTGAFSTQDKCWSTPSWNYDSANDRVYRLTWASADTVFLESNEMGGGQDGILTYFPISIRVKKP